MKNEKHFSKEGAYRFILASNLLLHKQVSLSGEQYLVHWLEQRSKNQPVSVLDLACRPAHRRYLRRPDKIEPILHQKTLAQFPAEKFDFPEAHLEGDWRLEFMDRYTRAVENMGGDEAILRTLTDHVMSRDFPLSVPEITEVASRAGFKLRMLELDATGEPLRDYHYLAAAAPIGCGFTLIDRNKK